MAHFALLYCWKIKISQRFRSHLYIVASGSNKTIAALRSAQGLLALSIALSKICTLAGSHYWKRATIAYSRTGLTKEN